LSGNAVEPLLQDLAQVQNGACGLDGAELPLVVEARAAEPPPLPLRRGDAQVQQSVARQGAEATFAVLGEGGAAAEGGRREQAPRVGNHGINRGPRVLVALVSVKQHDGVPARQGGGASYRRSSGSPAPLAVYENLGPHASAGPRQSHQHLLAHRVPNGPELVALHQLPKPTTRPRDGPSRRKRHPRQAHQRHVLILLEEPQPRTLLLPPLLHQQPVSMTSSSVADVAHRLFFLGRALAARPPKILFGTRV